MEGFFLAAATGLLLADWLLTGALLTGDPALLLDVVLVDVFAAFWGAGDLDTAFGEEADFFAFDFVPAIRL